MFSPPADDHTRLIVDSGSGRWTSRTRQIREVGRNAGANGPLGSDDLARDERPRGSGAGDGGTARRTTPVVRNGVRTARLVRTRGVDP